jgi:MFS family permease
LAVAVLGFFVITFDAVVVNVALSTLRDDLGGAAAAAMMPSSMALVGQAYPDPVKRARAVGIWRWAEPPPAPPGPCSGG